MRPIRALLLISCLSCHKYARPLPVLERPASEDRYSFSDKARVAKLVKVLFDLPLGYRYGELRFGSGGRCSGRSLDFTNLDGPYERNVDDFADVFSRTLKQHAYPVEDEAGVFQQSGRAAATVLVAARILEETFNKCYPNAGERNERTFGGAHLNIEWTLYSTVEKKVILTTVTEGTTYGEMESEVGEVGILRQAFLDATERLARDRSYRAAIDPASVASPTAKRNRIRIRRVPESSDGLEQNLLATRNSLVNVVGEGPAGSGFVLAAPGWVLTSAQVVGDSRIVKLTLADGTRCYAEVTATSTIRDLALLEAKCPRLAPLPLLGDEVTGRGRVSIVRPVPPGTPGSLERGVAKGTRAILGMTYLQSDVRVVPGDEGGPLLDIHGNVVAVISRSMALEAERAGLNLFVPLGDISRYLPIDFE
jgi:S1-C subfamily serine protease